MNLKTAGALALLLAAPAHAQQEQDAEETEVYRDWLVESNWIDQYEDGLLTLNIDDLERFVQTGVAHERYQIGPLHVEKKAGVYYSGKDNPDTSLDVPASVLVRLDDKIMAGGKGKFFSTDVQDDIIVIEHWNGKLGCTLSRWFLRYDLEKLDLIGSEYADFETKESCIPEPEAQ